MISSNRTLLRRPRAPLGERGGGGVNRLLGLGPAEPRDRADDFSSSGIVDLNRAARVAGDPAAVDVTRFAEQLAVAQQLAHPALDS
jgi:hypothetical protein